MTRYIVLRPAPEFDLPRGILLRVLKYLHGLSESVNAWNSSVKKAIFKLLTMGTLAGDSANTYIKFSKPFEAPRTTKKMNTPYQKRDIWRQHCYNKTDLS